MSKIIKATLQQSPVILAASLLVANSVVAQEATLGEKNVNNKVNSLEQINQYAEESEGMDQVTSVSQLRDVQPTDWAFQALQSLVERYGCIAGYPDGTYRGNRAMTRFEFAAGLNACMDKVNQLIGAGTGLVKKEDLLTLQKLQQSFDAELSTMRGRVDALEARTAELEANQFSTTTKLKGEVIFNLSSIFGDRLAVPAGSARAARGSLVENTVFTERARLIFDTSFSGKDLLRTRIQARNISAFASGTNMTRLAVEGNNNNNFELEKLFYRVPLASSTTLQIDATNAEFNDNVNNFNPLFAGSGNGSISRFGRYNPLYRQLQGSPGGAALTLRHNLSKQFELSLGYQALRSNDPSAKAGLFDGGYAALAQLAFKPVKTLDLGFTYVRSYAPGSDVNVSGSTGGDFSTTPFAYRSGNAFQNLATGSLTKVATSSDNFGIQASWRVSPKFVISGWGGLTEARAEVNRSVNGVNLIKSGETATIVNWAVTLGLPDFGKKGNLLGFVFGMPPKVTDSDLRGRNVVNAAGAIVGQEPNRKDRDTSYHIEGFYRIQVNDNISITPGAFVILNPEHNDRNDAIWVGTIRTTFSF